MITEEAGIEPAFSLSKSDVIPLDHSSIGKSEIKTQKSEVIVK